jgi:uncharacterized protein YecT (DUF1311 family)
MEIGSLVRAALVALVVLGAAGAPARAGCLDEIGAERSGVMVEQCLAVTPATHPPCNALNACEMIRGEITRSCAQFTAGDTNQPAFCKPYLAGATFVPRIKVVFHPGFDCAKATTPVETAICADKDLSDADRRMTEAFAKRLKASAEAAALRQDQRAFLQDRAHCTDAEPGHPDDERSRLVAACIYDLTGGRADELAATADGAWLVFTEGKPPDLTCSLRFGHDGSDAVEIERHAGDPPMLRFSEFVFRFLPLLKATDQAGFDVDGSAFPATVTIPPDTGDASPTIAAAVDDRSALPHALATGRMLRVKRNGKVIFRAPLANFPAADAQTRHDCGMPARPAGG